MRYIERLNKDVNNVYIYRKAKQRCKQWDI